RCNACRWFGEELSKVGALRRLRSFSFTDTAPPGIYTLSLHDALPIWNPDAGERHRRAVGAAHTERVPLAVGGDPVGKWNTLGMRDRKSTRLNSSHVSISYAVFCLKKKTKSKEHTS